MSQLREDLELVVREITKPKIKEYQFEMTLDSNGSAIHITPEFNGILKYILVESSTIDAELKIISSKYRWFTILEDKSFSNNKPYFPKHINVFTDSTVLDFDGGQFSEIPLNGTYEVSINRGQSGDLIRITLVYV